MVEHMSVRDSLTRQQRVLSAVLLTAWIVGMLCGGSSSAQRPDEPIRRYTFEAAFIVFALLCAYAHFFALRCPRCKRSLGRLASKRLWSFPTDVQHCPHCDLDLDTDIHATQTI